jgi:hypothetical protein
VSANPGWYPDPGGGQGLFRYWDGKAWSSAVSPNPSAPAPSQGLVGGGTPQQGGQPDGQGGQPAYGQSPYGQDYGSNAYANYQELEKKKSPIGWWIAGAALVLVIVVVAVLAIRAVTGGDTGTTGGGASNATLTGRLPAGDLCKP